jgi:hypothetical protein
MNSRVRNPSARYEPGDSYTTGVVAQRRPAKTYEDYAAEFDVTINTIRNTELLKFINSTFIARSTGYILNNNQEYISLDDGLFMRHDIDAKKPIKVFMGVLRIQADYKVLVEHGRGGKAIQLNKLCVLDCYDEVACHCSKANSPLNALDIDGLNLFSNARLKISTIHFGLVYLMSTEPIAEEEEVFYDYNTEYIFTEL